MKTSNLKGTLAKVFAVTMVFSVAFATGCKENSESAKQSAFIKSIGGVSETYQGAVSQANYNTAEKAAEAFVEDELVGEADCEIEDVTSKGEMSASEIAKLKLTDDMAEGMKGVEKLEVKYIQDDYDSGYAAAYTDVLNKTKKVTVHVIKYESHFKYYSPAPITGDTITKSYYDSIFNSEKYSNCTYKSAISMKMNMTVSYQGESQKMNMVMGMKQQIKYSEDKIYLEQNVSYSVAGGGESEIANETVYAYMEMLDTEIVCYVKDNDSNEWYEGSLSTIGFSSLEELTPFYDQYLDYSYFTKTNYGFEIADENAKLFIEETLSDALGEMGFDEMLDMFKIDMFAKYYVSEGVLSGMRQDITMKMDMEELGAKMKMSADIIGETSCTDYGTTVVTKPFTE